MPLSVFRGRVVGDGEPQWLDDDRRWALAWQYDQDSRAACGCYPDETFGPENADRFLVEPQICHRHRAIGEAAQARAKMATEQPEAGTAVHGVLWRTVRDG